MTDFFDSWFKRGKSNSEEAAFIFNCKDPRLNNSKFKFPAKNNDYSGVKPDTWEWEVLETYYIFESAVTADWEQCFDIEADFNFWFRHPKETTPSHFYCLALNKGIQIPVPLKDAYLRLLKRQSESVSRVSTDTSAEAIKNEKPDKVDAKANTESAEGDKSKGSKAVSSEDGQGLPWIKKARELGQSLKRDFPDYSQVTIAGKVRLIMEKQKITGRGGRVPSEDSIRKHALKGI